MAQTNRKRLARIETEARKLARSGAFYDFRSIQCELRANGFLEVDKVFSNRWTQSELDRLCRKALAKKSAWFSRSAPRAAA
jgi:hypothetical protein